MIFDIFKQINFLDIFIVILLFRICYIATKMGMTIEIFKFLGVIFATYISLHYYVNLSDIIQRSLLPRGIPLEFIDYLIFLVLALTGYIAFVAIRGIFYRFIKLETVPLINKFGGLLLGVLRGFFVVGLLVFTLSISNISYLSRSVKHSYLGNRAFMISPNTYSWLWNNIFSKFSTHEKYNFTIDETVYRFNRQ